MSSEYSSTGSGCSVEVARLLTRLGKLDAHSQNNNGKGVETESDRVHALSLGLGMGRLDLDLGIRPTTFPLPFDLNLDQAELYKDNCETISFPKLDVKFEEVCNSAKPGHVRRASQTRGRSRQNLTEAEKEARKVRRILANRESARQTIRRRQAMHEDLIQKAAKLASENEELKSGKKSAVKEFKSLQRMNQTLKEQISQISGRNKGDKEKPPSFSGVVDTQSFFSPNWPYLMYSTPSQAFTWPSCSQFSSSCMLHKNQNDYNALTNWCISPYPWVFPVPPQYAVNNGGVDTEADLANDKTIPRLASHVAENEKESFTSGEGRNGEELKWSGRVGKRGNVGAEARKRRRELMKLKSQHCHTVG